MLCIIINHYYLIRYVIHFANNWCFYTLMTYLPTFVKSKFDIPTGYASYLSMYPFMSYSIVQLIIGFISDKMISSGLSILATRKIVASVGFIVTAIFLLIPV